MRLAKVHVTNFRSVEDSGEFDLGQVLALVGKNEAGKTALLQAIAGLNPHPLTPVSFDIERDYPRRFLTEYKQRHSKENATVISTKWELNDAEKAAIREEIGDGLTDEPVVVSRRYEDKTPQREYPIDWKKTIANLIAKENLDEEEQATLANAENSKTLRERLEKIA